MVKTRCEVYARIVGYLRPVDQWNDGKAAEFSDRKTFDNAFTDVPTADNSSLKEFIS